MLSKKLIIFEGPDGAGKTTLAKSVAKQMGAVYTHLGPFPRVNLGLARLYVEAILPAVLGYADVVLDRCWLSEAPYGQAFRQGQDRLGERLRLLERLAWRCQTMVFICKPSWPTVKRNFEARKGVDEYLENAEQLSSVYQHYDVAITSLPVMVTDPFAYPAGAGVDFVLWKAEEHASRPHPVSMASAGNIRGPVLLVGEDFGKIQDSEPLYQWPFGSLANSGCSLWLSRQLEKAGIGENKLMWCNADQLDTFTVNRHDLQVVALGRNASEKIVELGRVDHYWVPHPQAWKRFNAAKDYPLIPLLKGPLHA